MPDIFDFTVCLVYASGRVCTRPAHITSNELDSHRTSKTGQPIHGCKDVTKSRRILSFKGSVMNDSQFDGGVSSRILSRPSTDPEQVRSTQHTAGSIT